MKKISLTQGQYALVDDEDFEYLNQFKWYAYRRHIKYTYYAGRTIRENGSKKTIRMHNIIAQRYFENNYEQIDHKDRNGLNNQKENLRICSISQNCMNRRSYGVSNFSGVSLHKYSHMLKNGLKEYVKWRARIKVNGKSIFLGSFKTELEASEAYKKAAKIHFGEFANI